VYAVLSEMLAIFAYSRVMSSKADFPVVTEIVVLSSLRNTPDALMRRMFGREVAWWSAQHFNTRIAFSTTAGSMRKPMIRQMKRSVSSPLVASNTPEVRASQYTLSKAFGHRGLS
jgi:hypothetical protein